jgi:nucleotide-binding universal stress UspA family protein
MRILLGADGSPYARLAEEILSRLPEWKAAEVVAACAGPGSGAVAVSGERIVPQVGEVYEEASRQARDFAREAANRLRSSGVQASEAYLEGDAADALLEFAERNEVDATAIGSRGLGGLQSVLLGSVARKLVAHAPGDVLVGRVAQDADPEEASKRVREKEKLSVVVGVDGSAGSEVALEFLRRQGEGAFAQAVALCVEPLGVVPSGLDPASFAGAYKHDHERAAAIAERSAQQIAACAESVRHQTGLGRAAHMLSEAARQAEADLIVVGATRHGTLERFLIGSVSYELVTEAPCSVLVVRPKRS